MNYLLDAALVVLFLIILLLAAIGVLMSNAIGEPSLLTQPWWLDTVLKFLELAIKALQIVIWPLVVIYVTYIFQEQIGLLIDRVIGGTVKAGGAEVTVETDRQEKATNRLEQASEDKETGDSSASISAVVKSLDSPILRRAEERSVVLWVDDKPSNNNMERLALEEYNMSILFAEDTELAFELLAENDVKAIISDMHRHSNDEAGLDLLRNLPSQHPPVFIYTSVDKSEQNREALALGAVCVTTSPSVLFEQVLIAVERGSAHKQN